MTNTRNCIISFNENGPFYVCVSCNRSLYKHSVKIFFKEKYPDFYFAHIHPGDEVEYICITCDSYLIKGKIPSQAVCNKLETYNVPNHFDDMRLLEKVLVAQRLLFKKVITMPRGEFQKI